MNFPIELLDHLRSARHVAVLTGAGVSAESGIPTFREAQTGLWERYTPEDLATPQAFQNNPRLVWEWYVWRAELVALAQSNPGHFALSAMADQVPKLTLITQNVDGLHQAAGSQGVLELHGSLHRYRCSREGTLVTNWKEVGSIPPRCSACSAYLRPDVVWFGESLPQAILTAAIQAAQDCDTFFSIGTSSLVYPAASLPLLALEHGAVCIEINPLPTPLTSSVTYHFQGPSGDILPALLQAAWP